jgi:CelD/BcsL family acetyltransferase involved in cellulose biosynthesis
MGTLNALKPSGRFNAQVDAPQPLLVSQAAPSQEIKELELELELELNSDGAISTTTYFSWSSLAEITPGWNRILDMNRTLSIFSTPEWLRSWWEAFGSNRRLVVLAFSDTEGSLVGLAPMYWEFTKHPLLGRLKRLRMVGDGSGDSDNLDLIVEPGWEHKCASALISWLARHRNCGICSLNTFPSNSLAAKAIVAQLGAAKWLIREATTPNSCIPLPSSWELYIESLSPKFRRQVTRCRKKVESQFQTRLHRCERAADIPTMLETLYRLHQKRWTSANEKGSFVSAERRDFYARMALAFFNRGWLELWTLELNGKPVAAQMSFRYRDHVYGLQEGYDTDYAAFHVGYVLRAAMLEYFIETGARSYDFLGGFTPQKQRWGAELGAYTNVDFAPPHSLASFCLSLDMKAAKSKEWLRQHLPSAAWSVLHRAKMSMVHEDSAEIPKLPISTVEDAQSGAQEVAL